MELFKLFGTIALNNSEANEGIDETTDKAEKSESKIGQAFGKIGKAAVVVGTAIATGLAVGTGAAIKLGKEAIDAYSDYEQLVGGVETLFGKSADIVMKYADNAYKTAGMSANQYMETVTSFSASLLQSLDGDTDKAAKKADKAITDMSDNVNKMGSSIESIQNAYQGFAKQNYTMLDNLKLGYGGTKEEMQRLLSDAEKLSGQKFDLSSYADIVDAIHIVQTEMGITGTTAKEASTTIQGSVSSMIASWQNLLVGMTDESQDFDKLLSNFVDSVITVIDNILPRVSVVADKIPHLISALVGELPGIVKGILPSIIEAAITLVEGVVNALPSILSALVAVLPLLLEGLSLITNAIVSAIPQLIQQLVNFLANGSNVQLLITAALNLLLAIPNAITQILPVLSSSLPSIITNIVTSLVSALPQMHNAALQLLMAIVDAIPQLILSLSAALPTIVETVIQGIISMIPQLIEGALTFFNAIIQAIPLLIPILIDSIDGIVMSLVNGLIDAIPVLLDGALQLLMAIVFAIPQLIVALVNEAPKIISSLITALLKRIPMLLKAAMTLFQVMISAIPKIASQLFVKAGDLVSSVINGIKSLPQKGKEIFDNLKNRVLQTAINLRDNAKKKFNDIFHAIVNPIIKARDKIKEIIDKIKGFFSDLKLKFPDIPTPHFSVTPSGWKIGDLMKGSIPKLGIDWYAKAMNDGLIMNEPTVFGINSKGEAMAGGEVGSETVVGTQSLMNMIQNAVNTANNKANETLERILAVIISMDNSLYDKIVTALQTMGIEFDERELARLVKKYA